MTAAASRLRRFAACLLVVGACAAAKAAEPTSSSTHALASENSAARDADEAHPISDMVEELQKIQVRMATGDKTAYALQGEKLRAIGAAIAGAKPDVWKKKSETDAAAAYVLSGGQPTIIARLLESNAVPKSEDNLLRGALAYAAGRAQDAIVLLGEIDPRSVSLRLGAQLAYARSVLVTAKSPDQAIQLLDLARLLAPGTLVEEAALRREILVTGDRHYADRMIFLSRQYVSRFRNSIYAETFIQGLATASVRYGLIDDVASLRKFETLLGLLTAEQRRAFLLTIAREQTINGKFEVAGAAAHDALPELAAGSADETRARLYAATARFMGENYEAGVSELTALDRTHLSRADQSLLLAALHVAAHLRDSPSDAEFAEIDHEVEVAIARSPTPVDPNPNDPVGVTIHHTELALQHANELLRRSEKSR